MNDQKRNDLFFFSALFLALLPFPFIINAIQMPADAAWLIQAAEHFLNGQKLSEYYFDTNPPLCFLVYIPVVFLENLGLSTWSSLKLYTGLINLFAVGLSFYFLKFWDISSFQKRLIIMAFAFATSICMVLGYGQKDHLIAMALIPFCLAQIAITRDHNASKGWVIFTLLFFVPFILIKPHYGLLPAAILLHRFFKNKSFRILMAPDFLVLAISVLAYLGVIILAFPDFLEIVLPLSLKIYVESTGVHYQTKYTIACAAISICAAVIAYGSQGTDKEKQLSYILSGLALLAVIPYWIQGKGFTLHLIPFFCLLMATIAASMALPINSILQKKQIYHWFWIAPLFAYGIMFFGYPEARYHHEYWYSHPLIKELHGEDGQNKSFYIENNSTNFAVQTEEYTDMEYASRFSANWFIPVSGTFGQEELKHYWILTGNMVAEDINRYKPETILLIDSNDIVTLSNGYINHPNLEDALSHYEFDRIYDEGDIFFETKKVTGKDKMPYKIYKRKSEN